MKRLIVIIFMGVLSFAGNWVFSYYRGIPVPIVHDEFSYLLAADTFAHGRVTNPPHPLWQHFETFHELMQPTYMSKYPPAQGFVMAVGQVLWGKPIYGVWLSAALMCMAICWMLYAWVPSQWALIGGLVSVLQFGIFTYWSQSYWGGAVAAMGGALIFGAAPRVLKYQRSRDAIWLGLGIAVLVNSRPFEGICLGLPVLCLALPWKAQWDKIRDLHFVKKIALPLILILSLTVIGDGAYNKAVTGKASLFPYTAYLRVQMAVPLFIWEPLRPMPVYLHQRISDFEKRFNNRYFLKKRTWQGFWSDEGHDTYRIFMFYFGYVLAIPVILFLPGFLCSWRRVSKFLLIVLIILGTSMVMTYRAQVHYYAPLTCLAVLLVVLGFRALIGVFKKGAVKLAAALIVVQLLINLSEVPSLAMYGSYGSLTQGRGIGPGGAYTREQFKNLLMQKGGKHLVLVDYPPGHLIFNEWVFNGADIDSQPIVWARSMNEAEDAQLMDYFKDRRVWRVAVNGEFIPRKMYDQR